MYGGAGYMRGLFDCWIGGGMGDVFNVELGTSGVRLWARYANRYVYCSGNVKMRWTTGVEEVYTHFGVRAYPFEGHLLLTFGGVVGTKGDAIYGMPFVSAQVRTLRFVLYYTLHDIYDYDAGVVSYVFRWVFWD